MVKTKNNFKKMAALIIPSLLLIAGCTPQTTSTQTENIPTIVGTFYPVSEIAKAIGQDTIKVETLIPTGAEPHSYEPTAKQIVELSKADAFIVMEGMFENIEQKIINSNKNIKIIDTADNLELIEISESEHEHHEDETHEESEHEESEHNHADGDFDPHTWLSIHNMEIMTEEITTQLTEMFPENKEMYELNKIKYLTKLQILENQYQTELSSCNQNVILVNHQSFGYVAHEYNFEQISVNGFNPESEPTPKTIQNIIKEAKEHNLKYIFSEGQLDKKTANLLANEINGQVLELNPVLTTESSYIELMENNLKNLKLGLECNNSNQ
jgi:zinc transport system substrate-binding protein